MLEVPHIDLTGRSGDSVNNITLDLYAAFLFKPFNGRLNKIFQVAKVGFEPARRLNAINREQFRRDVGWLRVCQ
jgi:hypothetical protein